MWGNGIWVEVRETEKAKEKRTMIGGIVEGVVGYRGKKMMGKKTFFLGIWVVLMLFFSSARCEEKNERGQEKNSDSAQPLHV